MFDVTIVGGGLAGLSLLQALKPALSQGLSVALVDANSPPSSQHTSPSFDDRTSAISRQTLALLADWQVDYDHGTPMRRIHISEQRGLASVELDAKQLGVDCFGQVMRNKALGQALWQARPQGVTFFHQQTAQAVRVHSDHVSLVLNQDQLTSRLLVIADGGHSTLLSQLGIQRHSYDYQQYAHVFNCRFQHPAAHTAFERFTPDGALALLPLDGNFSGVLVSHDPQVDIERCVQQRFGWRYGALNKVGQAQSYPLALQQAQEQVRHRIIVAGNSALALHPVAGQGYNLIARSMAHIGKHCLAHSDPGQLPALQALAQRIQGDQTLTKYFSDGLARGFTGLSLKAARQLAMFGLDQSALIKSPFSQFAMGARHAKL